MCKSNYREIKVYTGATIETVVSMLQKYHQQGDKVYVKFKGCCLFSDTVTMETAYKEVLGISKTELDKAREQRKALYSMSEN